jgi:hypothetical protein
MRSIAEKEKRQTMQVERELDQELQRGDAKHRGKRIRPTMQVERELEHQL